MAITPAQARANKKSQGRLDAITLRPLKEEGAAIRAAAESAGLNLSQYILSAVRARMSADAAGGYLVRISEEEARASAERQGKTLENWLAGHQ